MRPTLCSRLARSARWGALIAVAVPAAARAAEDAGPVARLLDEGLTAMIKVIIGVVLLLFTALISGVVTRQHFQGDSEGARIAGAIIAAGWLIAVGVVIGFAFWR